MSERDKREYEKLKNLVDITNSRIVPFESILKNPTKHLSKKEVYKMFIEPTIQKLINEYENPNIFMNTYGSISFMMGTFFLDNRDIRDIGFYISKNKIKLLIREYNGVEIDIKITEDKFYFKHPEYKLLLNKETE